MLLVLAGLILSAAVIVSIAHMQLACRRPREAREGAEAPGQRQPSPDRRITYLQLMAAMVFIAAITTQWSAFS